MRVRLLLAALLIFVSTVAPAGSDMLTTLIADERSGQWPTPLTDRYQLPYPPVDASPAQILAIIAERDRQYGQRFDAQEKAVVAALAAAEKGVASALVTAEKAVLKAEAYSDKRFDSVTTQVSNQFKEVERRLTELSEALNKSAGSRQGSQDMWGWIVGAGGFLLTILSLVLLFTKLRDKTA